MKQSSHTETHDVEDIEPEIVVVVDPIFDKDIDDEEPEIEETEVIETEIDEPEIEVTEPEPENDVAEPEPTKPEITETVDVEEIPAQIFTPPETKPNPSRPVEEIAEKEIVVIVTEEEQAPITISKPLVTTEVTDDAT